MNKNIITGLKIIGIVTLLAYLYFFVKIYNGLKTEGGNRESTIHLIGESMILAIWEIVWDIVMGVICVFEKDCKL